MFLHRSCLLPSHILSYVARECSLYCDRDYHWMWSIFWQVIIIIGSMTKNTWKLWIPLSLNCSWCYYRAFIVSQASGAEIVNYLRHTLLQINTFVCVIHKIHSKRIYTFQSLTSSFMGKINTIPRSLFFSPLEHMLITRPFTSPHTAQ